MPKPTKRSEQLFAYVLLLVLFSGSRILFYFLGVRFDTTPLHWFFQILDPVHLKTDLCQSLFYLHSQPPGFNLLVGIVLNVFPSYGFAFRTLYLLCGLLIVFGLFFMFEKLNTPRIVSIPLTVFFMVSPPVVLFENWLFYSYPTVLLLVTSSVLLYLYLEKRNSTVLVLFFLSLSAIVFMRSLFTLFWFLAILIGLVLHDKKNSTRIIICALFPLLLIIGLHVKNYCVFRQTTLSSWFGMNLAKMTFTVPRETIKQHITQGEITEIALIKPFRSLKVYNKFTNIDTVTGIPVLDAPYKSTRFPNYNHISYVSISQQYRDAAMFLITRHPAYYGLSVSKAVYAYLRPTCDSVIFRGNNRKRLHGYIHFYETYLLGNVLTHIWQTKYTSELGQSRVVHINFLYVFLPILYIWSIIIAIRPHKADICDKAGAGLMQYIAFNLFYVTAIGNLIEVSENMRFRFLLVPFTYILLATLLTRLIKKK